jgi:hypothetical protein
MDHPENKEDDDHDHDHADDPDATAPVVHLNLLWTRWPESIGGSDRTWAVAHPWYALTSILRKRVPSLVVAQFGEPLPQAWAPHVGGGLEADWAKRLAIVEGTIRIVAVRSTQNYVVKLQT